jgi:phage replication-related protein YjqB (UPF0714/DUF867 family)
MDAKYRNFEDLASHEVEGVDYCIRTRSDGATLILAPHGGGIEPGTSELADAIAATEHSLYLFEGLKGSGNRGLHITSSHFDEKTCCEMLARADLVIAIHGEEQDNAAVFIGGLDRASIDRLSRSLTSAGFAVKTPDNDRLAGQARANVCNRGRGGAGVQLEITDGLRSSFFRALSPRAERQHTTAAFSCFVNAVRETLLDLRAL